MSRRSGPLESETCREYVLPALRAAGWQPEQIVEQRYFTDGRIIAMAFGHRRSEGKRADYLLQLKPDVPLAIVEAKREYRLPGDGLQQAMDYAELLGLGLAYASNGLGIVEHDYDSGHQREVPAFPSPEEMWARHQAWRGISAPVADVIALPYNRDLRNPDGSVKRPRYYQAVAINRAVEAALSGRKRILLTMATGTGKTFVALQVVWKLWQSTFADGRRPRVLYLADRNILVDQPIEREFRPVFGEAIWKIKGEARSGREIYFALYQSLADTPNGLGSFHDFPPDFFDLVIVDECHRGSARDESSWRRVLEYFAPATQLGMTATPLRDDNVDTYEYFGKPIYAGAWDRRWLPGAVSRPQGRAESGRPRLVARSRPTRSLRPRDPGRPVRHDGLRTSRVTPGTNQSGSETPDRASAPDRPIRQDHRLLCRPGTRRADAPGAA